ncbi:hypothetical protein MKX01_020541, partial [Papaver californicum]
MEAPATKTVILVTHQDEFLAEADRISRYKRLKRQAAGNPHIRLYEVNSTSPQPVISYDSHTSNIMAVGFQCDGNWMYSGSEDGTVKIWDLRAPGCQKEYESRAAVNTVVLHPNQVPEVDIPVRSLTVMWDESWVVAANNHGTGYAWHLMCGMQTITSFEPLHKLQAHNGYILSV